jgi:hypothetical protein
MILSVILLFFLQVRGKMHNTLSKINHLIFYIALEHAASTYSWTLSTAPVTDWFSIASSGTGQYQIASSTINGPNMTGVYLSNDYGKSWTNVFISGAGLGLPWAGVAISSAGNNMFALQQNLGLFVSHDYGWSWTRTIIDSALTYASWNSVSCSADAQYVITSCPGCYVYYSSNVGYSFKRANLADSIFFVSMSPSGKYAVAGTNYLYYSSNYGATFTKTSAPSQSWYGVDYSGVDAIAVAVAEGSSQSPGGIYVSGTSGQGWTLSNANRTLAWRGCAADGTGQTMFATATSSGVYVSSDGGKNFVSSSSPTGSFRGVACDYNAAHPVVMSTGSSSGKIYYGTQLTEKLLP